MEARGFQVLADVGDDLGGLRRQRHGGVLDHPIDVVNPETDPLEMEGRDGALERFRFLEQTAQLIFLSRHAADDGQEVVETALGRLAVFGGHDRTIVAPDRVLRMETGRARIQPPDLSEKGGLKDGEPQRSDERLFMQLLAFGGCADTAAVSSPLKPQYTMLGRTYSLGYEPDLRDALIERPRRTVLNRDWRWAIWYPLRRSGGFAQLPEPEQRAILAEHGAIGKSFGAADYAHDVRLACHGLDRDDNDFVIGLIGKDLFPLSAVVQAMRKTQQTALYLDRLGPFFVGRAVWQSNL